MHWRGDWTDHRVSPDVSENRNISWSSRESNITLPRPYPSHYTYWYSDSKLYQYTNLHVSRESLPNQMFAGSARLLTPIIRQQIVRRWIAPPPPWEKRSYQVSLKVSQIVHNFKYVWTPHIVRFPWACFSLVQRANKNYWPFLFLQYIAPLHYIPRAT